MLYIRAYDPGLRRRQGDYRWVSLGHRDRQAAQRYATKQHAKLLEGATEVLDEKPRLSRILAEYVEHRTPNKKRQDERDSDRRRAQLWTQVLGGNKDPYRISSAEWEGFERQRRSGAIDAWGRAVCEAERRPVGPRTVASDMLWLKWVFGFAANRRHTNGQCMLRGNPLRGLDIPTEQNPKRPVASTDRFEALRAVSDLVRLETRRPGKYSKSRSYFSELLDIAADSGRRISAICALRFSDILLERNAIRWRGEEDKCGFEGEVPMGVRTRAAIERIMRERPSVGDVPLFPSPTDPLKPMSRQRADRWLRRAERLAGLQPLKGGAWHPYRRLWATARKHLPVQDVAAAGGWKSTVCLSRIYQQPDRETMLRVILEGAELREIKR